MKCAEVEEAIRVKVEKNEYRCRFAQKAQIKTFTRETMQINIEVEFVFIRAIRG